MGRSIREEEEKEILKKTIADSTLVYKKGESTMGPKMIAFTIELMGQIEHLINESGESLKLNDETREAYQRIADYLRVKARQIEEQINE